MVWNLRKVYSDRNVCVWFSFLAKTDKQSVISSDFCNKRSTAARHLDEGS